MEQYPDIISLTVGGASTQGTDGTWSAPIKTKYTFYCRAEANTSGRKIIGSDGQYYDFQFAVFAPLDGEVTCLTGSTTTYSTVDLVIADIESKESAYELLNTYGKTLKGNIKRAHNGQFNARVWL
jgi:hypothetical protein